MKTTSRDAVRLTSELIDRLSSGMYEYLSPVAVAFRKAYLGAPVDRDEVDDREICSIGRNGIVERCVPGGAKP